MLCTPYTLFFSSSEATMGFEPMMKVLQTSALPLGHVAKKMLIVDWRSLIFTIHNLQPSISNSESGRRDSNPWPSPWQGDVIPLNYARKFRSAPTANRECREPESNWRHHNFQSCALPTELSRLIHFVKCRPDFTRVTLDCQASIGRGCN